MENKINVDVVIISYAKTAYLHLVTKTGIASLLASEDHIKFNVFVVESNKNINYDEYDGVKTIYTDKPFSYNGYLNLGISQGNSEYVFLANNDLTYEHGWASEIMLQMGLHPEVMSASPFCPQTQNANDWKHGEIFLGNRLRVEFAGWAIFMQRKIFKKIGELPTGVDFWYSDNLLIDLLNYHGLIHGLVPKSVVNHHEFNLGETGSSILDEKTKNEFTVGQYQKYLEARTKLYAGKSLV